LDADPATPSCEERFGHGQRTFRVIGKRDDDADQPPVLVVEDSS
jgi:hypothetical protein